MSQLMRDGLSALRDIAIALIPRRIRALWGLGQSFSWRLGAHDVSGHATSMAFYALLAIFPTIVGLLGVLSFFDLNEEVLALENFLSRVLPSDAAELIMIEVSQILDASVGRPLTLGLLAAVYYAGRALAVTIDGVGRAWSARRPRWLARRLQGAAAAGISLVLSIVSLVAVSSEGVLLDWLIAREILPSSVSWVAAVRGPIMVLFVQQTVNLIYRIGSGRRSWGWSSLGGWLATFAWVAISYLFRVYISEVTDLGATYGSLGTVVGLMFYLQATATAVLIGAEIDAWRYERKRL